MKVNNVIIAPVLTEKSTKLAQKQVYLFYVNDHATKHQVKNTLESMYQVTVDGVRTQMRKGKTRRVGRALRTVQRADRKIAYVTVSKGTIDIFPKP